MEQGSNAWYYLFPAVLSLITLIGYKRKSTGVIILLILLFFSMFRGDHVGTDTLNYMNADSIRYVGGSLEFEVSADYIEDNFGSRTEFLNILLNKFVYYFDLPARIIIFTYSVITLLVLYFALIRFNVNTSVGLLIYVLAGFFYDSLNWARQLTAVSIVLWGMTSLLINNNELNLYGKDDKPLKYKPLIIYIVSILIASMIHASSIFYIVLYPLRYLKVKRKLVSMAVFFVTLVCVLFSFNIMDLVYKLINMEYVARYIGLYDEGGRSIMGRIFDVMRFAFYIYIFIYCTKRKYTNTYDILYALAIILMAVFVQTNALLSRITYYITVFICVYIPYSFVERERIHYGNKFLLFIIYLIISIYGTGKYGCGSLSGYCLMF